MSDGLEEAGLRFVTEGDAAFRSAISGAQNATSGLYNTLDDAPKRANVMQAALTGAFTAVASAATSLLASAGQALFNFVGDAVKDAGNFESGMNLFEAAAGKAMTNAGLKTEEFRDLFLDLGKKLPVSTADVQEAATTLVKGGLDPMILKMGGLEDALKFAAAAGLDLNEAAEISIKQMAAFVPVTADAAERTKFLAESQNFLVKAAGASTGDVDKLSQAVLVSAGQAKAAGLEYTDFVTAMTLVGDQFPSAAEAGTSFKNFLTRLQPTTKAQTAAMQALGLVTAEGRSVFYDANGAFIGMEKTSQILQDAFKGLTDEQRSTFQTTIFGNDAIGAANALINAGAAGYKQYTKSIADANGVQEQYDATMKGFNVAQDNLNGSLETLRITVGTYVLPILADLFNNVISPAVNTITNFADSFFKASSKLSFFAQALGISESAVFDITSALASILPSTEEVQYALDSIALDVYPTFKNISSIVTGFVNDIGSVIFAVFGEVQKFVAAHGEEIMAIFKQAWETIQTIIEFAAFVYQKLISPAIAKVAADIQAHSKEIQAILTIAWTVIRTIITTALSLIQGIIKVVMALINGDVDGAMKIIQQTITTIWNDIKKAVEDIVSALKNAIGTQFEQIKTSISNAIGGALQSVKDTLDNWKAVGEGIIKSIVDGITNKITTVTDTLKEAMNSALLSAIGIFPSAIQEAIKTFLGLGGPKVSGFKIAGRGGGYGGVNYGGNTTYQLNVTAQPSMGVVSDFAIMKAWGG